MKLAERFRALTSPAALAAGLAALALIGCSLPVDETAQAIDPDDLPEGLRPGFTPTTTSPAPLPLTESRAVFLLTNPQDTERTVAVAVERQVPRNGAVGGVLATLFGQSTTAEEQSEGFFNSLELFEMNAVTVGDGVATVDIMPISEEDLPPPAETLKLVAAQLVFTVAASGIEGTRILLNGEAVSIPTSDDDADPGSVLRVGSYEQFQPDLPSAAGTAATPAATAEPSTTAAAR